MGGSTAYVAPQQDCLADVPWNSWVGFYVVNYATSILLICLPETKCLYKRGFTQKMQPNDACANDGIHSQPTTNQLIYFHDVASDLSSKHVTAAIDLSNSSFLWTPPFFAFAFRPPRDVVFCDVFASLPVCFDRYSRYSCAATALGTFRISCLHIVTRIFVNVGTLISFARSLFTSQDTRNSSEVVV